MSAARGAISSAEKCWIALRSESMVSPRSKFRPGSCMGCLLKIVGRARLLCAEKPQLTPCPVAIGATMVANHATILGRSHVFIPVPERRPRGHADGLRESHCAGLRALRHGPRRRSGGGTD